MSIIAIAIATMFNFCIIVWKFKKARWIDGILDVTTMGIICTLFSGSFDALTVGMMSSMGISFYLLFFPPKFSMPKTITTNTRNRRRRVRHA